MSTLSESFFLCSSTGKHPPTFERDSSEDNIIVTHNHRNVATYHVRDQKVVSEWPVKSGHEMSCAVVNDCNTGQFVTVLNGQTIRMWNSEDRVIDKTCKIQVKNPVYKLLSFADTEPLVLFEDGSVAWLSQAIDNLVLNHCLGKGERILHCEGGTRGGSVILCVLVERQNDPEHLEVYVYEIGTTVSMASVSQYSLHLEDVSMPKVNVCRFAFMYSLPNPSLFILGSDGVLYKCEFVSGGKCDILPLSQLAVCDTGVAVHCVGENQIAVAGFKSEDQVGVALWDIKFAVLQAWRPYPVDKPVRTLYHNSNFLFVDLGGEVHVYPCVVQPSTLSLALGKFGHAASGAELHTPQNEDHESNSTLTVLDELLDPHMRVKGSTFKHGVTQLLTLLSARTEDTPLLQHRLGKLVLKCTSDKRHFPREQIHQLIKAGLVPTTHCTLLVDSLLLHKELTLLHSCLLHVRNIPESALAKCLHFFVQSSDEVFNTVVDEEMTDDQEPEKEEAKCPFCNAKAAFVNEVLTQSYNDVFMLECLKKVEFSASLELLGYLFYLLQSTSPSTAAEDPDSRRSPSILQVVDWLCLVLDANFTHLILSGDAKMLLAELQDLVQEQVKFYDELVSLEAILSQIKSHSQVKEKQQTYQYNIITLHVA